MYKYALYLAMICTTLAACSSTPTRNTSLDNASTRLSEARSDPQVRKFAAEELQAADDSLKTAEHAWQTRAKLETINHLAYLANQHVTIARETANSRADQAVTAEAAAVRDRMLLAQRTSEADAARRDLAESEQNSARKSNALAIANANAERDSQRIAQSNSETDMARRDLAYANEVDARKSQELADADVKARQSDMRLNQSSAETEKARRELALSEQSNARKTGEIAAAQARAQRSDARADELQSQLELLNAKKTERGMVLTLGDVLFETGQSQLLQSSMANIINLAAFFKRYPERKAVIEGHTDNVGTSNSNITLSQNRANAVFAVLAKNGAASSQLSTLGLGEDRPVSSNNTAAGRQLNRRVEIIFTPVGKEESVN